MRPKAPKCEGQVGDKYKIMRPKAPVKDKCGRQLEDKSKIMRPKAPKCEGQVGDKCKLMRPKAPRVGDKYEKISVGDKCKLMRPKAPRVGDKCEETSGRQV